ncbi:MAG: aldehyde dehydrogenase family protein, partial [Dongia sp.]
MRVAGTFGSTDRSFDVFNPYDNQVVGTCPKATVDDIKQAFAVAKGYKASLSRADRSAILRKTAEILVARKQQIAELITAESGLSMKDTLYEVGRAYDVFHLAGSIVIKDDGE